MRISRSIRTTLSKMLGPRLCCTKHTKASKNRTSSIRSWKSFIRRVDNMWAWLDFTTMQRLTPPYYCHNKNWKPPPPEGVISSTLQPRQSTDSPAPHPPQFAADLGNMSQQPQNFPRGNYPASHSASLMPAFFAPPPSGYTSNWRTRQWLRSWTPLVLLVCDLDPRNASHSSQFSYY